MEKEDKIIFSPEDVDKFPIQESVGEETRIMAAFNPGLERLPNGNLILMVRVAEALEEPIREGKIRSIRWAPEGYQLDEYDLKNVDRDDPRLFKINSYENEVYGLTSLSWLLPVELNSDGGEVEKIHYDKIIEPTNIHQEYGLEDARLVKIEDKYYMTVCGVSSSGINTFLYSSENGLDYELEDIILDYNKDVVLSPEKVDSKYYALTRPTADIYFPSNEKGAGPSIRMAESPDLVHWKPLKRQLIRPRENEIKVGGGSQPVEMDGKWIILFHVVEKGDIGKYKTFYALLDKERPWRVLEREGPILEPNSKLTEGMDKYVEDVVFTTGIVRNKDSYIVASGEDDLCCRITHLPKEIFREK